MGTHVAYGCEYCILPRSSLASGVNKPFQEHSAWTGRQLGTDARVPLTDDLPRFIDLSARLTGFDEASLQATGLTEVYQAVAAEELGIERYARLLRELRELDDAMDGELRDAARAVTYLWYTGSWPGPPPTVVSSRAYAEGLVWKAAGLKAPATDPGGYGSWGETGDRTGQGAGAEGSGR
ncbi:hypothetical protein [Streptomyces melanogenes]|uniref:hypothetical protein n=1 Tax=Streptomyces melanogenes TaxID=67326 RepID=UPI001E510BB4|nr:hypothetical protein [Streptomyces melanogenes]